MAEETLVVSPKSPQFCHSCMHDVGLSGSRLHVWYKALFQELLQQWSAHANSVLALHKTRKGPLQQEAADAALLQLKHCGRAFASLLTLNKIHLKRIQV